MIAIIMMESGKPVMEVGGGKEGLPSENQGGLYLTSQVTKSLQE